MSETLKSICPACSEKRVHTPEDWKNHPYAGHGFVHGHGWTHPDLEKEERKNRP